LGAIPSVCCNCSEPLRDGSRSVLHGATTAFTPVIMTLHIDASVV